jgi:HPt (histidine-containing phosphotransfer) domain-containing protein
MSTHEWVNTTTTSLRNSEFNQAQICRTDDTSTSIRSAPLSPSPLRPFAELVNVEELLDRIDHDRELLREIFGLFQSELPGLMADLRSAVQKGNLERANIVAHTLKGMLANLAVTRGTAAAAAIEELARLGHTKELAPALASLEEEMAALLPSVSAYLAGAN